MIYRIRYWLLRIWHCWILRKAYPPGVVPGIIYYVTNVTRDGFQFEVDGQIAEVTGTTQRPENGDAVTFQ